MKLRNNLLSSSTSYATQYYPSPSFPPRQAVDAVTRNIETTTSLLDLFGILLSEKRFPLRYWKSRTGTETLFIGEQWASELIHPVGVNWRDQLRAEYKILMEALSASDGMRAFVAIHFDPEREAAAQWEGFPSYKIAIPDACITREVSGEIRFAGHTDGLQDLIAAHSNGGPPSSDGPSKAAIINENARRYLETVKNTLAEIREGRFQKAVIAREIILEAEHLFDPTRILTGLGNGANDSFLGCIALSPERFFITASPEMLVHVDGEGAVRTEAVAGTFAQRESNGVADRRDAEKLNREHLFVAEFISRRLIDHCLYLERRAHDAMNLTYANHLRTRFSAQLESESSILDLMAALHPTPAVGGFPQEEAMHFLREHEGLDRGLYAGMMGTFHIEQSGGANRLAGEIAVGIRSALVTGTTARVFTGAGIVEGSDPEAELDETVMKARPLLQAFGAL